MDVAFVVEIVPRVVHLIMDSHMIAAVLEEVGLGWIDGVFLFVRTEQSPLMHGQNGLYFLMEQMPMGFTRLAKPGMKL
jgi:hypothetical protein